MPQNLQKRLKHSFPALHVRNFRVFWLAQIVSNVGGWMQTIGQSWLVLQLTHSPSALGVVSAMQFLPMLFFSLFAGPFVDRLAKRRTLFVTQSLLMLLALVLSALSALGVIQYWMIIILALALGFVNTLDVPTRQSFVVELAGREHLVNAISLNSTMFNLARMIGPAIAGVLISLVGIAPCFLLNGLSFVAVLFALRGIDVGLVPQADKTATPTRVRTSIADGIRYVKSEPGILMPIVLMAFISTFVINYGIFIPIFTTDVLGGDAAGFGLLMTCIGIGSLVSALTLALRGNAEIRASTVLLGAVGMSASLLVCALGRNFLLTCAVLVALGFFTIRFTASSNAYVQMKSRDDMRGRVMSLYSLVFGGVTPIGALYAGQLIQEFGAPSIMIVSGIIGLCSSAAVAFIVLRLQKRTDASRSSNP